LSTKILKSDGYIGYAYLGGSITAIGKGDRDLSDYGRRGNQVSPDEVVDLIGRNRTRRIDVGSPAGLSLSPRLSVWYEQVKTLIEYHRSNPACRGFILTHGSGFAEDFAFFCHVMLADVRVPFVVVPSIRPWNAISTDGPLAVLRAAEFVWECSRTHPGCWLISDSHVLSSVFATKVDPASSAAFEAAWSGGGANFSGLGLRNVEPPSRLHANSTGLLGDSSGVKWAGSTRVPSISAFAAHDADDFLELVDADADAIVVAVRGDSAVPEWLRDVLSGRKSSAPIVFASLAARGFAAVDGWGIRNSFSAGVLQPGKALIVTKAALALNPESFTGSRGEQLFAPFSWGA